MIFLYRSRFVYLRVMSFSFGVLWEDFAEKWRPRREGRLARVAASPLAEGDAAGHKKVGALLAAVCSV
jgi:hypothetical protein